MDNKNTHSKKGKKPYGIIYRATNTVNGKVYIGQTVRRLTVRINAHLNNAKDSNLKHIYFYRAINKYSSKAFKWEVIESTANKHELNEKEVYWIAYYNSHGEGGYNSTDGGEGLKGYKVTDEGIERRKNVLNEMWANGHVHTMKRGEDAHNTVLRNDEVIKIRDLLIENKHTQAEIGKMFNVSFGIVHKIKKGATWSHLITERDVEKMNSHENKGTVKLSDNQIIEIKKLFLETETPIQKIYDMFNIGSSAMWYLLNNKKWSHLFTEDEYQKIKERRDNKRFTEKEIIEIKFLLSQKKLKQKEIAEIFGMRPSYVSKIARGEKWKRVTVPDNYKSKHK